MRLPDKENDRMKKEIIPKLNDELANLSNSHPKFVIRKKSTPTLTFLKNYLPQWESLNLESDDIGELKRAKELLERGALQVNKNWNGEPIDLFINAYAAAFRLPQKTILHSTQFNFYKSAASQVAHRIWEKRKNLTFFQLLMEMEKEDRYVLSQNAISLGPRLVFLEKDYSRLTGRVMRKYQSLYHELNGHMEKMTRILVGLKLTLEDQTVTYSELKKRDLSPLIDLLKSSELFQPLISPFDTTIRNTIAHVSTRFDDKNSTMVMVDRKKVVSISYSAFVRQIRELAASAIVISHLDNLVAIEALNYLRTKLQQHGLIRP